MNFDGKAILLDIEGTTSSVSFVYDVMFPQVRRELHGFLESEWDNMDVQLACDQIARDAGHAGVEAWCGPNSMDQRENVENEVIRLMDGDEKATGLKQLQGLIWRRAFESGEMLAHVFPDVPDQLQVWRSAGIDIRIYSSGSIQAQKLFFGHSEAGNLLPLFTGHYDTTIGSKRESTSYAKIAADWGRSPQDVLFLSDVLAELDAASSAAFHTGLCVRPGNAEVSEPHQHEVVESFRQINVLANPA